MNFVAGLPGLPMPPEHDARKAARELTAYLTLIGGINGRGKEDKARIAAWCRRMGIDNPKGYYDRNVARTVSQLGFVPVAPLYWPADGEALARSQWMAYLRACATADKPRAAQWAKLRADSIRS